MKKIKEKNSSWKINIKISREFNLEKFINIWVLQRLMYNSHNNKKNNNSQNGKKSSDT